MKIAYKHLSNFLIDKPRIEDISKKLFQLGHEHEIEESIFDFEFTPNRGDCLSLLGLARDLNVFYKTNLELSSYVGDIPELDLNFLNNVKNKCPSIYFLNIEIENTPENYKNYLDDYFKDLKLNKKNFFTDISNYVAYETGQPTHCYDFETIDKDIILTDNVNQDNFETLLGNKIKLEQPDLVFINNNKVINLAGVVGSIETSCSKKTRNVLIESAYFVPESVLGKSVKYNIQSDASHKFERGVDPKSQEKALRRFIQIVEDHTRIKKLSIYRDDQNNFKDVNLDIDVNKVNSILGIQETAENYKKSLLKLGFKFDNKISVPSYRSDITNQNDLAEEFARIIGYDNIQTKTINLPLKAELAHSLEDNIKLFLIDNGFFEVINYPFSSIKNKNSIKVDNPLDSNRSYLRTNLLDSLVNNLIYNEKRQQDSIKLFEISDVYSNEQSIIDKRLSIIISGRKGRNYKDFNKKLDKEYLLNLFKNYNVDFEDQIIEIQRDKLDTKVKTKIFGLEVSINQISKNFSSYKTISKPINKYVQYELISEFPSILRDISFSIKDKESIESLCKFIFSYNHELIKDIFIFDFYENSDNEIIKLGFRFTFQSKTKTLTDNEVDKIMKKLMNECITSIKKIDILGL